MRKLPRSHAFPMRKFALIAISGLSAPSFANTLGIEGLQQFDCMVESTTGEIERELPIGKAILAQSQEQATALYLLHLEANMVAKKISIPFQTSSDKAMKWAELKKVECSKL